MGVGQKLGTRSVERCIAAGTLERCAGCPEDIRFTARDRSRTQVICNIYVDGVWDRVEHFHSECYEMAGRPYGDPTR